MEVSVLSINNSYMIVRLGFLVAASVAAYAVRQINVQAGKPSSSLTKGSGNLFSGLVVFHSTLFYSVTIIILSHMLNSQEQ